MASYLSPQSSPAVSGPNGLWKQVLILDPFLKICQVQKSLDNYSQLFELVTEIPTNEEEFDNYLAEPVPENPELKVLEYWHSVEQCYPNLAQAA